MDVSPSAAIWTMCYTFTPPISPRVFTVLKVTHLEETSPRTGLVLLQYKCDLPLCLSLFRSYIVGIPVDLTVSGSEDLLKFEESGVKGRYVSIDRLMELEDGRTEWRMATSSTPGGSIPEFLSESLMDDTITQVRDSASLSGLIADVLNCLGRPPFPRVAT
jgi:hypothetical protein